MRGRCRPPLLLSGPSRAASWSRPAARGALAALVLAVLAATIVGARAAWPVLDPSLAAGIADGVRHGGYFAEVAADAYRQAGDPLTAAETPLPATAIVTGALPPLAVVAMLGLAASAVMLGWWGALATTTRSLAAPAIGAALVLAGLVGASRPVAIALPETWAGLLVALSLARWRPGATMEAAAFGLAAAVMAKPALLYLGVMIVADRRDRRALLSWAAALLVAGLVLALQVRALAAVALPPDAPQKAAGIGARAALALPGATALGEIPVVLGLPLAVLALAGWMSWRDPRGQRALTFLAALAVVLAVTGREDLAGWGLVGAPVALLGLIALPDLLRDMAAAALDKRRLTVTRLAR